MFLLFKGSVKVSTEDQMCIFLQSLYYTKPLILKLLPVLLSSVSETASKGPVGEGDETGPGGGLSLSCGRLFEVSMPLTLLA